MFWISDNIDFLATGVTSFLAIVTPLYYTTNIWSVLPTVALSLIGYLRLYITKRKRTELTGKRCSTLSLMIEEGHIQTRTTSGIIITPSEDLITEHGAIIVDNVICRYEMVNDQGKYFIDGLHADKNCLIKKIDEYARAKDSKVQVKYFRLDKTNKKTQKTLYINPIYAPEFYSSENFDFVDTTIKEFLSNEKFYEDTGIPYRLGFCFSGDKGTGKTLFAYAIAKHFNMDIIEIDPEYVFNFSDLPSITNSIVLLDDFDMYNNVTSRDSVENTQALKNLMKFFDGHHLRKVIFVATTNYKDRVEDALIRPGLLDFVLEFDELKVEEQKLLLRRFYPSRKDDISKIGELKSMKISTSINKVIVPNIRDYESCMRLLR